MLWLLHSVTKIKQLIEIMSQGARRSSTKNKDDSGSCPLCNKVVTDRDHGVSCEICDRWYHDKCEKVSDGGSMSLSNNPNMHWYCSACNKGVGDRKKG